MLIHCAVTLTRLHTAAVASHVRPSRLVARSPLGNLILHSTVLARSLLAENVLISFMTLTQKLRKGQGDLAVCDHLCIARCFS